MRSSGSSALSERLLPFHTLLFLISQVRARRARACPSVVSTRPHPPTVALRCSLQAAANQEDYTIFDSMIVQGMLQWKWESFAATIFHVEFTIFMIHLLFVCTFSYFSSLTMSMEEVRALVCVRACSHLRYAVRHPPARARAARNTVRGN